ncbi:hypothetical protein MLD38_009409 [Melastoma candidum]|uniref:Uncharacterized protein n=1 Tax=Melastoma candidum TaxID=119954 RepID=A0ACB9RX47_9MYRT|nr:hypothetical protein MLD38_009409 [Melastoma candidum]
MSEPSKTWVVASITFRPASLRPIFTGSPAVIPSSDEERSSDEPATTPTGEDSRIPTSFMCPPPVPRKRKPALKYRYGHREFFATPPDLEAVFVRRSATR